MESSKRVCFLLLVKLSVSGVLCYLLFSSSHRLRIFFISVSHEDLQNIMDGSKENNLILNNPKTIVDDCLSLRDIEAKYLKTTEELYKLKNAVNNVKCGYSKELELKLDETMEELLKLKNSQTNDVRNHSVNTDYSRNKDEGQMRIQEIPGEVPTTAYYVWCGDKPFLFRDYLSILSIIRVIQPLKLVFYYNTLPSADQQSTWFDELRQSLPLLDLVQIDTNIQCNTLDALGVVLEKLAVSKVGGIFVGERITLTRIPDELITRNSIAYSSRGGKFSEEIIVFVKQNDQTNLDIEEFKTAVLKSSLECHTPEQYDSNAVGSNPFTDRNHSSLCIVLSNTIYPEYIANSTSSFSAVIRSLYYGKPDRVFPKQTQDPTDLAPLINHLILVNSNTHQPIDWTFEFYLCVLSALYVARFQRVYVHGNTEPTGKYWNKLKAENVTFVHIESFSSVFQKQIKETAHKADVLRALVLFKYGGVYNDNDVLWMNPISNDLRRYPAVASLELSGEAEFSRVVSSRVLVSKPKAPFFTHVLKAFWHSGENVTALNSAQIYYKILQRYPDTIHLDRNLQIVCSDVNIYTCLPVWIGDSQNKSQHYTIKDAFAVHFAHQGSPSVSKSFANVNTRTGIGAVLINQIMQAVKQAGKKDLLVDNL
ncbi:uncharacterized protein LOC131941134 [Physella acuta]|uniref:uncharacterized protein LOC131941134 n=1 Tax=Physella acuta TaxID=109671 RepID=UPI0027DB8F35|nr:uncharacterized protein LOC131941134 [Physella acuta]